MPKQNYIYGRNPVIESLKAGNPIEKIFIAFGTRGDAINKIFSMAKRNGIQCVSYDSRKFDELEKKICPKNKSQGVIALISQIEEISLNELISLSFSKTDNPVLVALDEITDPHNLGAIARTAECSGAAGILMTERNTAPLSPTSIKVSAGALEIIPVCKVGNIVQAFEELKEHGFWIVGSSLKAEKSYREIDYDMPLVLVIGSEGKGLRPSTEKHCDILIKIPQYGKIESLNASVSAGILLFEIAGQKNIRLKI